MSNNIIIAVDAMGGDNSPMKIIDGIELSLKDTDENFFQLYGDEKILNTLIKNKHRIKKHCEIYHVESIIKEEESPLVAAKKGNTTSMWRSIESQKKNKFDLTCLIYEGSCVSASKNNIEKKSTFSKN